MLRTALIGTAIVAGCFVYGCDKGGSTTPSSNNQSTPPAVSTPAHEGSKTAGQGAESASNPKVAAAFQKVHDDLKEMKIDDAKSDLKSLEDMKGSMSADDLTKLQALTAEVNGAHAATTMPAMPLH